VDTSQTADSVADANSLRNIRSAVACQHLPVSLQRLDYRVHVEDAAAQVSADAF